MGNEVWMMGEVASSQSSLGTVDGSEGGLHQKQVQSLGELID